MASLADNGLKEKSYNFFKKELLQTYGFHHLLTLNNLEKLGLLKKQNTKGHWSNIKKAFQLIKEDVNIEQPDDCSYVYAGLAPLISRLVEAILKEGGQGWKQWLEPLDKYISGPTIWSQNTSNVGQENQFVIVYVIGGITRAEISSIRYIAKKYNKEIVICTS